MLQSDALVNIFSPILIPLGAEGPCGNAGCTHGSVLGHLQGVHR